MDPEIVQLCIDSVVQTEFEEVGAVPPEHAIKNWVSSLYGVSPSLMKQYKKAKEISFPKQSEQDKRVYAAALEQERQVLLEDPYLLAEFGF